MRTVPTVHRNTSTHVAASKPSSKLANRWPPAVRTRPTLHAVTLRPGERGGFSKPQQPCSASACREQLKSDSKHEGRRAVS